MCEDLQTALESWIVVGLRHGDGLPVIDGTQGRPIASR
jgi:hypothetical protein